MIRPKTDSANIKKEYKMHRTEEGNLVLQVKIRSNQRNSKNSKSKNANTHNGKIE